MTATTQESRSGYLLRLRRFYARLSDDWVQALILRLHPQLLRMLLLGADSVLRTDRITNLQPPTKYWIVEKVQSCQQEARQIYEALYEGSPALAARLQQKIEKYSRYYQVTIQVRSDGK